jgi:hypothetical protein
MNLVFLDFDGVLTPFKRNDEYERVCHDIVGELGCLKFEPTAVCELNLICDTGKASIVISSSWRYYIPKLETMRAMLRAQGVSGSVIGMCDSWGNMHQSRGEEIESFMEPLDVDGFVILDDTDFGWDRIRDHWVETDPYKCITRENAESALAILHHLP